MGKKSKFPMFFGHKRGEGSTSLHKHRGLIIGDLEKVIDLKTQYLIETFNLDFATGDLDSIKNIKELTYAEVSAEDDGYTDYLFYPLLEKNKKNPTAFLCLHLYTCPYLDEKGIGINSLIEKYVKKKYLIKKININCGKICFFPLANDLKNKPFVTKIFDNFNLNLISPGKNRIEVIKQIRKIRECGLEEAKKITEKLPSLIKSWKETPTFTFWDRKRVRDIRDELIKCGAKVELINLSKRGLLDFIPKENFDNLFNS